MMNLYVLAIKSHCEAPDFEAELEASSKKKAMKLFKKRYRKALAEYDDDFIWNHLGRVVFSLDTQNKK